MLFRSKITKKYKDTIALSNISFALKEGEILGILGPNGSGKSTLVKLICGLISPDEGKINLEINSKHGKTANLGIVFEEHGFFKELTVEKNLKYYCILKDISFESLAEISDICGINSFLHKKVKRLSMGMLQRLAWARSLLNQPDFYVYDDPTIGLDPKGIVDLRKLLLKLKSENKSILVTSHNLTEMEKICNNVLLLNKGETIYYGTVNELLQKYGNLETAYLTLIQ